MESVNRNTCLLHLSNSQTTMSDNAEDMDLQ